LVKATVNKTKMKNISNSIFRSLAIIFLMSCTKYNNYESIEMQAPMGETQATLSNGGNMSFAKGQAALLLTHLNGQVQHFSFHVIKDANGNVTGTWESKSPGQELRTHGILDCLTFLDDHTAYMTGVVTQKIGDVFPGEYEVGMPVWFKVRDNGEGNNSSADEFTDYYSLQGIECVNYEQASIHPIISGNIQVRR
jgi:hypothetical protein